MTIMFLNVLLSTSLLVATPQDAPDTAPPDQTEMTEADPLLEGWEDEEWVEFELIDFGRVFDLDGDGKVGRYEAAAAAMQIALEIEAAGSSTEAFGERLADRAAWRFEWMDLLFEELDTDRSGLLETEELDDEILDMLELEPEDLDVDGDGEIRRRDLMMFELGEPSAMEIGEEVDFLIEEMGDPDTAGIDYDSMPEDLRRELPRRHDTDGNGRLDHAELVEAFLLPLRPARYTVKGTTARLTGTLGPDIAARTLRLLLDHPEVRTLVLLECAGSIDDDANALAGRLIHAAGLATLVPHDGVIASGGVDIFLAGTPATASSGAMIGVHAWSDDMMEIEAEDFERDHPAHEPYLSYLREIEAPEAFYWFSIEAAPADDIHWMTEAELVRFGVKSAAQ
jgi:hypothetical protein